jgi:carbamoylphosphate synthase large subunit
MKNLVIGGKRSESPFVVSISKKQPRSFSSFKFVASTITTQEITSTTTFMQVNTSCFKESMQKLIGASNLDLEKFPITMASMQAIAKVSVSYIEVTCTHKQHDNTFGGLFSQSLLVTCYSPTSL